MVGTPMGPVPDGDVDTLVVLPSWTQQRADLLARVMPIHHYEEEMLFSLLFLRRPDLRLVYVAADEIDDALVDYYLGHLPDPDGARSRLRIVTIDDTAPRSLAAKLVDDADAMRAIGGHLSGNAGIWPIEVTSQVWTVADGLGIGVYGPRPEHVPLGFKTGSRRLAKEAGVPILEGIEGLGSLDEVEAAIGELRDKRPDLTAVVVKLNRGFGGQGNVVVELDALHTSLENTTASFVLGQSWESFGERLEVEGAIVEEMITDEHAASPSVQMHIGRDGRVETLSTHDQILAGPEGQSYIGCRFPADAAYRSEIEAHATKIANLLAVKGVAGPFSVDFLAVPSGSGHHIYLTEINLRMTAALRDNLTATWAGGRAPDAYVALHNLKTEMWRGRDPESITGSLEDEGLAFDADDGTGVVLHLIPALVEHGRFGATCIGTSLAQAEEIHESLLEAFDAHPPEPGATEAA